LMDEDPCKRPSLLEWSNRMEVEEGSGSLVPSKRGLVSDDEDDDR